MSTIPPTLVEVLASARINDDPKALWPEKRPTIARQACVDFMAGKEQAEEWNLPCGAGEDDPEGCPENHRCLVAKRKEVGALMYDREFRTTPRAASSSLFPPERHQKAHRLDMSMVPSFKKGSNRFWVVNGWDIAWSERTGGDYLVKISAAVDRINGKKRVLDIARWQAMTFRQQVGLMRQEHLLYNVDLTVIEEAGAQSIWVQEVRDEDLDERRLTPEERAAKEKSEELQAALRDIRVLGHETSLKRDFVEGVPGLILDLDAGRWDFPMAEDGYHHEEMLNFLNELEAFGWNEDRLEGVGEHDDTVMAWWHTDWGLEYGKRHQGRSSSPAGRRTTR